MLNNNRCSICNKPLNYFINNTNERRYCGECDLDFRRFIVNYTRLVELIIDFYFNPQ